MDFVQWVLVNVTILEIRVQGLLVNRVFRKEIGKSNDRQKIMPINVDDMGIVILIPIIVTDHITEIRGRIITEIIMIPQELCMEML